MSAESEGGDTPTDLEDGAAGESTDHASESYGPDDGVLVVDSLTKRFGGLVAVDDLSFAVEKQEILGFIGPNGAGKSTTFNCITGVYPPSEGTVYYNGQEVTGSAFYRMVQNGMARTFQEFRPLEDRTVVGNVQISLVPDKLFSTSGLRGRTKAKAVELCERVGLGERLHQLPDELPHADMIRLELARAMATDPDLLLVDEPFAGLAEEDVKGLSDLIRSLRDEGTTFIVVDHNMRGLLQLIDRAIVINFGEKIADGTPEEITNDPAVRKAYLGSED
ncbi:ABC transporter ATP-binding protein [Haloglomus salinum]|jgi:branched-chain amino acid transport system ATP-binding protein|uniref:ABC transporter ATP-binding protein n=1 Tax=Haloglomus salinum TaxID=2962673 RepID=UPI0020CA1FC9|nr:ABC transporter ATP-binding protein [Haloglomus salinum]